MAKLIAVPYYGGKYSHLPWLLPLLSHEIRYCEPYFGSGSVLLNRFPSQLEVANDLDDVVINFFQVLRARPDEFMKHLRLTPYSRALFTDLRDQLRNKEIEDPLEKARAFFVVQRQSFMSTGRTWATSLQIRNGWSQMISRYNNGIEALGAVSNRLSGVLWESRDALRVIKDYDDADTMMYLDPPYLPEVRTTNREYKHETTNSHHRKLITLIKKCKGKIALSGYDNPYYNRRLKTWHKHMEHEKQLAGPRGFRQEILWTNYGLSDIRRGNQSSLVDFAEGLG